LRDIDLLFDCQIDTGILILGARHFSFFQLILPLSIISFSFTKKKDAIPIGAKETFGFSFDKIKICSNPTAFLSFWPPISPNASKLHFVVVPIGLSTTVFQFFDFQ
jgi:hypothetical protein